MSKFCPKCGAEVNDAKFCPECGTLLDSSVSQQKPPATGEKIAQPVYKPMPKQPAKKKKSGCLFGLLIFVVLMVGSIIYAVNNADKLEASSFRDVTGVTENQASAIMNNLHDCGMDKIDSIVHDDGLDNAHIKGEKGYRISSDGTNNIILYLKDGVINQLRWADKDLFINGKSVAKLSDFIMDTKEQTQYQLQCEETVKSVLKSPSTAKFPNILDWKFSKDTKQIVVQSYVDAQNSYGAELRSEFQFILSPDGKTVKSFILDGKEYIKK